MDQIRLDQDVQAAVRTLRSGGVIAYPTDTVWGIGCDATNAEAVKKIFAIKHRADHKALITLVADLGMLERTVADVPEVAYQLIECTDRPLTIVYDQGINVAPELCGPDGSIGVRVTTEAVSQAICRALRRPLVSTSANFSGEPTPAVFSQISEDLLSKVDYVCQSRRDEAPDAARRPSMVMRLEAGGKFTVLRK